MVYHVYPYLAQFSDVDQIHHINGSKAWKPGEVSKPGTWMWIKSKIWYGLVWYHTVSHCFYPFFFWISVLRCATKTKKIVDPQQHVIELGCEQQGDRIHTIFSPVPQGWLDPNLRCLELGRFQLLWTQTVQRMPSCAGLLVLRFWKLYEIWVLNVLLGKNLNKF